VGRLQVFRCSALQAGSCASSYALHSAGPLPGQHHDVAALIASKHAWCADSMHAAVGMKSGSAGLLPGSGPKAARLILTCRLICSARR